MRKSRKYLGASNETPYKQHEGINGIRQKWTDIWLNKLISNPKTGKQIRESLMKDQYGNHYVTYQTVLKDGEWYETGEWIPPSTVALFGGFTTALLDHLRGKAFLAFSQVEAKL